MHKNKNNKSNSTPMKKLCELTAEKKIIEAKKRIAKGYYKKDYIVDDIIEKVMNSLDKPR